MSIFSYLDKTLNSLQLLLKLKNDVEKKEVITLEKGKKRKEVITLEKKKTGSHNFAENVKNLNAAEHTACGNRTMI